MSFTAGLTLSIGDGGDPTEVFTEVPKINSMDGLGQTSPDINVSTWESGAEEYISGLADGDEITVNMNKLVDNPVQDGLIADAKQKVNRNFELAVDDSTKTETFLFTLSLKSWKFIPGGNTEKHTIEVTGKISGEITSVVTVNV